MKYINTARFSFKAICSIAALCILISFAGASYAEENPFVSLADSSLKFFTPMEGKITSVSGTTVTSDIGSEKGIQIGMRLEVTREGAPFIHPVTKEKLGILESHVGRVEVIAATEGSSTLRVLSGTPAEGDVLRVTSALVRVLFFQSSDVDWNVSQEYYETLKGTGRFALIDTAPGVVDEKEILDEAKKAGAEVALLLTSAKKGEDLILKQRMLWVEDGEQLSANLATIDPQLLADLRLGSELFTPKKAFIVTFDVPYSTSILGSGDIDGDGVRELIMGTDSKLSFHKVDGPLESALGGVEYDGPNSETIIWLDTYDLDGDKSDELVITSKNSSRVVSRVLKYKDGKLSTELEGNYFLRVVDGRLYGQKFREGEGFSGPVYPVDWGTSGKASKAKDLNLPEGVNIYDFSFIDNPQGGRSILAFNGSGQLYLYDEKHDILWISHTTYGEGVRSFTQKSSSPADLKIEDSSPTSMSREEWTVNDKIRVIGRSAIVVDRTPITSKAPGVGIKRSQIVGLNWMGSSFQEVPMFKDISGNVRDVAIVGDKIFVLTRPSIGFDVKKLIKGKNPMINKLYIYSLKGI